MPSVDTYMCCRHGFLCLLCFFAFPCFSFPVPRAFQDVRRQLEDGSALASSLQPLSVVSTSSCCYDANTCS